MEILHTLHKVMKFQINILKRLIRKSAAKIVSLLPIVCQYSPRKRLTTFKKFCNNVSTFPSSEESFSRGWYLAIIESEIIVRKQPISLKEDIENPKFNAGINHYQMGYKHLVPEIFLSCVPKAKIITGGDFLVLSPDNYIFSDSIHPNWIEIHPIYDKIRIPSFKYCPGSYFVLGGKWEDNYYHWLIDVLPRLSFIEQFEELRDIPLIVDNGKLKAFQKDSLQLAGISLERIIELEHEDYWNYLQVDKLYFPSFFSYSGNPTTTAISWVKSRFLNNVLPDTSSRGGYLYITRRDADKRRIINEDEIIGVLKNRGFEIICPGELSFLEQVKSFAQARVIIAPHGAGLTNIVFAPANAMVIEIFGENYINGCYWALSNICEHSYAFLIGVCENEDMYIPLDKFKALLDKVFENLK